MKPTEADVRCPHCHRVNELHADVGLGGPPRLPKSGDVGLCWGCGGISVFDTSDGRLSQRVPTDAEADAFLADPEIIAVMARMAVQRGSV